MTTFYIYSHPVMSKFTILQHTNFLLLKNVQEGNFIELLWIYKYTQMKALTYAYSRLLTIKKWTMCILVGRASPLNSVYSPW